MASVTEVLQRKSQNIAVQTNPAHDLHVVDVDVPEPGPTDCLVHVRATGICGSDVHFWKHGHIGDMVVCGENGLGHESAGVVIKTGKEVTRFKPGDPLVICGAGPIGLVSLLAAHAAGAAPIVITDLDENRLAKAKELVPRVRTVCVERGDDPQSLGKKMVDALGAEARLVLECTGVESSIHAGIYASAFGGSVFIIGVGKDFQNIPFMHLSSREIDVRFQYRYHDTYPKAISLVTEGLIDLKPLVTHRFKLEEGLEAFAAASNPASKAIKVQILDE
ncbi:hypothetical protein SLS64_009086 [Diaporthe eres]